MNKIRINVLARELEVKAHELIDKLPELGVTEKKTHSSSVDDDVADKLRQIFGGAGARASAEPSGSNGASSALVEESPAAHVAVEKPQPEAPEIARETEPAERDVTASATRIAPQPQRLRPPLATAPPAGAPRMPAAPAASTPGPAAPAREVPPPPRPTPAPPRPGQILSGPRQPLPAGMRPPEPVRLVTGAPPATARSTTIAQSPAMPSPGTPTARTPMSRPGLAGQPAARPIVPPRPDLAAKLSQPRPAGPGAPCCAAFRARRCASKGAPDARPANLSRPHSPRPTAHGASGSGCAARRSSRRKTGRTPSHAPDFARHGGPRHRAAPRRAAAPSRG